MFVGAPLRLKARAYASARPSPPPRPRPVSSTETLRSQLSAALRPLRPALPHVHPVARTWHTVTRDAAGSCPCTSLAPPNLSPRPGTREARLVCAPGCLLRAGPGRGFPVHPRVVQNLSTASPPGCGSSREEARSCSSPLAGWRWAEPCVAGGPTPGLGGAAWTRARGRARNSARAASVFRCVRFSFLLGGGYGLYLA